MSRTPALWIRRVRSCVGLSVFTAAIPSPSAILRRCPVVAILFGIALGSCSIFHQDLPNESPVVQVSEADTLRVKRGGQVELTVSASDEDDDPLTYEWIAFHLGPELESGEFTDPESPTTRWIAPGMIPDSLSRYRLVATIHDNQPETDDPREEFVIEVVQSSPVLIAPADTVASFREPVVVLDAFASDADGDALSFEWELLAGERVGMNTRSPAPGHSQVRLTTLIPDSLRLALAVTDGADTVRAEVLVEVPAPEVPEGGTVTLERSLPSGGTSLYEIDVYEYPNQRGVTPLLVDNWFEAAALCRAREMRLCTGAEWVSACQGPEGSRVSSTDDPEALPDAFGLRFCNEIGSDLAGDDPALDAVAPSGSFVNCASSAGVFDLTGNAFEWLVDFYFPASGSVDSVGRVGRFSISSTSFAGVACGQLAPRQETIFLEGDLPPLTQAFIDSVLGAPISVGFVAAAGNTPAFTTYFESGRGFRCCR